MWQFLHGFEGGKAMTNRRIGDWHAQLAARHRPGCRTRRGAMELRVVKSRRVSAAGSGLRQRDWVVPAVHRDRRHVVR